MALRVVLSRARPLGHQLKGGKFRFSGAVNGGGSSYSIVGHRSSHLNNNNNNNYYAPLACWNSFWRRHYYFLPPPPAQRVVYFPTTAGIHPIDDAETNDRVIKSADFAVKKAQDVAAAAAKDDVGGGAGDIRFVRVVRASANNVGVGLVHYYITLEALRGKADMNVYYAEVLDCPDQNLMKLINWEMVNESFSYPFEELRLSDFLKKKNQRERVAAKNSLVSTMLDEMELRCRDADAAKWVSCSGSIYPLSKNISFGMLNADSCPPIPTKDLIDHRPTVARHNVVPVFDIKTYEMVYEYALFAVGTQYKNEDERVHLKDVLWASKSKVNEGWVFRLILAARNGKKEVNFYYAIVKACPMKHLELLKWHLIPHHDEEEVAAMMQDRNWNLVYGALPMKLSEVINDLW